MYRVHNLTKQHMLYIYKNLPEYSYCRFILRNKDATKSKKRRALLSFLNKTR